MTKIIFEKHYDECYNASMKTPVLLLIFNRPETTGKVFEAIRQAKPAQLFIAADGPRKNNESDTIYCALTKEKVATIDWDCEVKTLYREENIGSKMALHSSITWFFENVECGIILEDDCLPNPSFFSFCEDMLFRYKDEPSIGLVSGDNYIPIEKMNIYDSGAVQYYFTRPIYTWGWATWKRAYAKYDMKMTTWPHLKKKKDLNKIFENSNTASFFTHTFDYAYTGRPSAWDIPWLYTCLSNEMYCIIPPRNLISNIGSIGEHSKEEGYLNNLPTYTINISKLEHPVIINRNITIENAILEELKISKFSLRLHIVDLLITLRIHSLVKYFYKTFNLNF